MARNRYVAFLRGINVAGKNLIRMPELQACLEHAGFSSVSTYIQSGNVMFGSTTAGADALTRAVEKALTDTFNLEIAVQLRSREQMRRIVDSAPKGFGSDPTGWRYDVIFLQAPLTTTEALKQVSTKDGVDTVTAGTGVLYFSRLISGVAQSHLGKLVTKPVYQRMTIRNWNTTTKVLALLER